MTTPRPMLKSSLRLGIFALLLCVTACASRPHSGVLIPSKVPAPAATVHDILIMTTRKRDASEGTWFSGERSGALDYAQASISVPSTHEPGQVEWPSFKPADPNKFFVPRSAAYLDDRKAMRTELNRRIAAAPSGDKSAFLFIHGYNTLFAEGLYRFTQFIHDSSYKGVPVLFTWASRGNLASYVYDMNSALVARTALQQSLKDLLASKARKVTILAHSMGNWLLMETILQMSPAERRQFERKVSTIVLAAPDIDIDVFRQQLKQIGKLRTPMLVLISKDDKALQLSEALAGGKARVGAYADDKELAELGVTVVDLTDIEGTGAINHNKFAAIAGLAPELRKAMQSGALSGKAARKPGALEQTGSDLKGFVSSTARIAITLPATLLTAPLKIVTGN